MDEMTAAIGTIEENSFIIQVRQETKDFEILTEEIKKRNYRKPLKKFPSSELLILY